MTNATSFPRQPIHTVYGGAHLFKADTAVKMGTLARAAFDEYAPDAAAVAGILETVDPEYARLATTIRERILAKLTREPVEDFRIDFEDGYGIRSDAEEDRHSKTIAGELAAGLAAGTLPPFIGIRIKSMAGETRRRALRTLELLLSSLVRSTRGKLPANFVITLPKLIGPRDVAAAARACAALERKLRLRRGALQLELMIETPQSIVAPDGSSALPALVAAGAGRVRGAHFGSYDYTALCGITAAWQHMRHPACDFAKHMMLVALAPTGVLVSDGATNILPVPPHRPEGDRGLTPEQRRENRDVVHRAWRVHVADIQHSLVNGYYQGWDLHPAQIPSRYAAVYAFFLSALPAATARLRNFVEKAAQATLVGNVFDDAATGQGLLNFFVRGLSSGAITVEEAAETGLSADELQSRSFVRILQSRRQTTGR